MRAADGRRPSSVKVPENIHRPSLAHPRRNLLLDLPIAWRLALGFLLAALIAAIATGFSGIQRAESLNREAGFYQSLLVTNTSLNNGASSLQLMNAKTQSTLVDASAAMPSVETLKQDQDAIRQLIARYNSVTEGYLKNYVLDQHPEQIAVLREAGQGGLVTQQRILAASMARTWQVYRDALNLILSDIASGRVGDAQAQVRAQAEPTNTDALSALHALIQFNGRLAGTVSEAASIEQSDQTLITVILAFVAFLLTALVGWIISDTLVRRLRVLRKVTESVEEGEWAARAVVIGTDEIGRVSGSVNGMLDTIVGLLDITRRQRDALQNAAERLFADIRIAGTGDLRVSAAVGGDPIGMLANAFNFTIGRFRRFVVRTQSSLDQIDIISRQEIQRAETFLISAQASMRGQNGSRGPAAPSAPSASNDSRKQPLFRNRAVESHSRADAYIMQARELLGKIAREGANYHARSVLDLAEQAYLSAGRLSQLALTAYNLGVPGATAAITRAQMNELHALGTLLSHLGAEANAIQKNTTAGLSEFDAVLKAIDEAWSIPTSAFVVDEVDAQQATSGYSFDLLRLSSEFANEVATLARQTMLLTREMRAHVAPFRLDQTQGSEIDLPLYTPGTDYSSPQSQNPIDPEQISWYQG
jgi:methyl-accepting chemotaxis protein